MQSRKVALPSLLLLFLIVFVAQSTVAVNAQQPYIYLVLVNGPIDMSCKANVSLVNGKQYGVLDCLSNNQLDYNQSSLLARMIIHLLAGVEAKLTSVKYTGEGFVVSYVNEEDIECLWKWVNETIDLSPLLNESLTVTIVYPLTTVCSTSPEHQTFSKTVSSDSANAITTYTYTRTSKLPWLANLTITYILANNSHTISVRGLLISQQTTTQVLPTSTSKPTWILVAIALSLLVGVWIWRRETLPIAAILAAILLLYALM